MKCEHHYCRCVRASELSRMADRVGSARLEREAVDVHFQEVECRFTDPEGKDPHALTTLVTTAKLQCPRESCRAIAYRKIVELKIDEPPRCLNCGTPMIVLNAKTSMQQVREVTG